MKPVSSQLRLRRVLLLWCAVLAAGIGYGMFCARTGMGIPCVLHEVTGLECPGCGLTRAVLALARLDIAAAFGYNVLWPLVLGYFLWIGIGGSLAYVKRGELCYLPGKIWMHAAVLSVVMAYGILRNIF